MKNLNETCESESPPKKKLKQTRLSFAITQNTEVKCSPETKKRRSTNCDEVPKKIRKISSEEKVPTADVILLSDDEDEKNNALPKSSTSNTSNISKQSITNVENTEEKENKVINTECNENDARVGSECKNPIIIDNNLQKSGKKIKKSKDTQKNKIAKTETVIQSTNKEIVEKETQVVCLLDEEETKNDETKSEDESETTKNSLECSDSNNSAVSKVSEDLENSGEDNHDTSSESGCEVLKVECEIIEIENDSEMAKVEFRKEIENPYKSPSKKLNPNDEVNPVELDHKSESEIPENLEEAADQRNEHSSLQSPVKVIDTSLTDAKVTPKCSGKREAVTPKASDGVNQHLTPKQLQKRLESAKKKEEKEQERLEKDRKKQEEKEERAKQKLEKEELKRKEKEEREEMKRKEKEDKDELKRKEKEEKDRLKEREKKDREEKEEAKRKEKEAKEEEKRKKLEAVEEEKRKKEIEKEEAEIKKKKAALAFANFFFAKKNNRNCRDNQTDCTNYRSTNDFLSSFVVKHDMRVAPLVRRSLRDIEKTSLETFLVDQKADKPELYLSLLKNKLTKSHYARATWSLDELKDEVTIVEPEEEINSTEGANFVIEERKQEALRPKLLCFCENRRPPYWGTWRKRNKRITGRRPFTKDEKVFDYECDSDEEWEEDEPGESISGSVAGSDDEADGDEYEVDNEFFVPHGYLSDEEGVEEDDIVSMSPETQKAKLKYLGDEFESEHKKPTERLKPRLFGVIWEKEDFGKPPTLADAIWNYLGKMEMMTFEIPVNLKPLSDGKDNDDECENNPDKPVSKKWRGINSEMIPNLIKLVHGNKNNRVFLVKEFQAFLSKSESTGKEVTELQQVSKLSIKRKIKEISKWMTCPDEGVMSGKSCWYVHKEIREKYGQTDLTLPNTWSYTLEPTSRSDNVRRITPIPVKTTPVAKPIAIRRKPSTPGDVTPTTKPITMYLL